jgi:peptidoglycan glycosyltransferase
MNKPITRLFALVVVMFALLIAFTSRWTVFDAKALQDNKLNARTLLETQRIRRGTIYADNDTALADSVSQPGDVYTRFYPFGSLFAAPVGYAFPNQLAAGIELFRNGVLTGTPIQHESVIDQLEGKQDGGDSVYTTLDPAAQQVAMSALAATHFGGAVVAMVPSTGAIKVFASFPSYNPNLIPDPKALAASDAASDDGLSGPEYDRVTEAQDPPGSIQKVVTAIAAIDTGQFTPTSLVNGNSPQTFEGIPLNNDENTSYGEITLTDGLTNSVNTVYANVAQKVGGTILARYMYRLGYYRKPPIDLPSGELKASGVRDQLGGPLIPPTGAVDVPLMGIGEGHLLVTPLQMVMVASAVANGGRLMTPYLTDYVTDADGSIVQRTKPTLFSTVMKPTTATAVGNMMEDVVQDGTAEAALAGFKIQVAGKTGTAELGNSKNSPNDAWFIAYAPGKDIAVAVDVEDTFDYGASAAAPIARDVIQSLVGGSS